MNAQTKSDKGFNQRYTAPADRAGYVIDEHGDLVKITETMIKNACVELKARCHVPKHSRR
ncbi:MAG: hypothetical protein EOP48_24895 [Sphingobacteriales bacterium]|nr:MAG: hypothetical protein EOP48_24895 [Sphingobacteriales bacterium]